MFNLNDDQIKFSKQIQRLLNQHYEGPVRELYESDQIYKTFNINLNNLRVQDNKLYINLLEDPNRFIQLFQKEIEDKIKEEYQQDYNEKFRLTFKGSLGQLTVSPRALNSSKINKLVKVYGVITYASKERMRLLQSTHFSDITKKYIFKEYLDYLPFKIDKETNYGTVSIPLYDDQQNPLSFEYGMSKYKDYQVLGLQELPECVPRGQLSRNVQVYLQDDLVDQTKPGERVAIIGVLKPVIGSNTKKGGTFKKILLAFAITSFEKELHKQEITPKDVLNINKISQREDLLDLFSRSMAPSIQGHRFIKEALILQLIGGTEIQTENKIRIRGDINVMLVGDPSTGKSQFLRKMMDLAPNSISTTGRGSTGVGLTAAVVIDKDSREKRLEAGAMVLADRGLVLVDEFDKMGEVDRVAMHEVMEQQTVSIAKAGIHVSLNARCSVLAAANPIYGEYSTSQTPGFNLGMQDTLLSRFDLIFIVLDQNDLDKDRKVAQKVTNNHRYYKNGTNQQQRDLKGILEEQLNKDNDTKSPLFQQYDQILQTDKSQQILSVEFLRKYLRIAKKKQPNLTDESSTFLSEKWSQIRNITSEKKNLMQVMPITIRSLESMVRLSTAYAKLRLSDTIDIRDVVQACDLYCKAFYGGYENLDINFFKNYEKFLNLGRKKKKKKKQRNLKGEQLKPIIKQTIKKKQRQKKKDKTKALLSLLHNTDIIKASSQQQSVVDHFNVDQLWNIIQQYPNNQIRLDTESITIIIIIRRYGQIISREWYHLQNLNNLKN